MKIRFSSDPIVAHETNGLAVRYASSKRQIANWRWRVLVLLVMTPLIIFLGRLLYGAVWADMPGFIVMEETVLKVPVSGKIVSTAQVGQEVQAGDTIVELRNDVLENEYATLLENRKKALLPAAFVRAAFDETSEAAMAEVQGLHQLRKEQYAVISDLAQQNAATDAEVVAAFMGMTNASRDLRAAKTRLIRPMRTVAALETARNPRISEVGVMLESLKIKATENGIVAQVFGKQGEWLMAGAEVALLRLQRPARIEVFVEPAWAKYATVNSWATVSFLDGYSHRARVSEVKMQAQRLPPDRANPLTVRHHSVVVLLEPEKGLPEQYRVNVLPVNVQFDRNLPVERLAFWKHRTENIVGTN